MKTQIIHNSSGEIVACLIGSSEVAKMNASLDQFVIEADFFADPAMHYIKNGVIVKYPPRPDHPSRFDFISHEWVFDEAAAWQRLRTERNARLTASDWTQASDYASQHKAAWSVYRQALRDLPAKTEDPRNPLWPVPPTAAGTLEK